MKIGDTFYLRGPENPNPHLWVVISDPCIDSTNVVIVSFTSYKPGKDDTCMVRRGDHPNITHDTCMQYRSATILPLDKMIAAKDSRAIDLQSPASPQLLRRIQEGAILSQEIPIKAQQIILNQWVDPD